MTLFRDHISDHLTGAPADQLARQTYPGMAHFAATGPRGKTCRECIFWNHGPHDYRAKNGKYRGLIEPARCKKYQQLTTFEGDKIPDEAAACRYFDQNETPPDRFAKSS